MGAEIKRTELYEKVWQQPLRDLAKEFGVSDQAVGKACLRANIPRPGRGYWAKLSAGKKARKMPLPLRGPGENDTIRIGRYEEHRRTEDEVIADIPEQPSYEETLEAMRERVVKMVGKVSYPRITTKTHPIVQNFLTWEESRKREYARTGYDWQKPHYDSLVERRRLRILNALFLAAHSLGYKPDMSTKQHIHANRTSSINVGTQFPEFELKAIPPRGRDEQAKRLELTITGRDRPPSAKYYWADADDVPIESQLDEILVELVMAAEYQLRSLHQSHYEWQVKWREELIEKRRQAILEQELLERAAIELAEQARIDKLLGEAHALHQAETIRTYVSRVMAEQNEDKESIKQWAEWALQTADTLDPILNRAYLVSDVE